MALPVLFNDLVVYRQRSGIGSYAQLLLEHLPSADSEIRIVPLSQTLAGYPLRELSKVMAAGQGGTTRSLRASLLGPVKQFAHRALDGYLSAMLSSSRWPLYHEPDGLPYGVRAPIITTIHDLSVQLFPQWHPPHRVAKYEENFRIGRDRTHLFLADSHSTARDLQTLWGIEADRVKVVHLAPRPRFRPADPASVRRVKETLRLPDSYFLFVGTIEPRKNVTGLLKAYRALPESLRSKVPLVLAGGWGWRTAEIESLLSDPLLAGVRFTGYLPDEDLVPLLSGATALVYPSFYEGFGLPPLEAMACGVPVITSHGGSLQEVVADAALVVDPKHVAGITEAMVRVAESAELRSQLIEKGTAWEKRFSWERTAKETAAAYRMVYEKSGGSC